MWWGAVLVFSLAIIDNISAQDDNNATETQTKMCCPCPPGWPGVPVDSAVGLGPGPMERGADGVDDCPCRARDADSEGAASLFFPHAVRAPGNVMRPDPKEDPKPLLHPEVDLASSVLQTLREATDEEYRDALERDAARAAVDVATLADLTDGTPEEARNVVTIIVSPRDMDGSDAVPEASHVQETRCIHSLLGNPRALTYRAPVPHKGLEDILNLPLPSGMLHRQRDSGLAASNVHESVVRADDHLNKLLSGLKLKAEPSLLNLDPKTINENLNNILSGVNLGVKAGSNSFDRSEVDNSDANMDSSNDQISSEVVEENKVFTKNDSDRQSVGQDDLDCNTSPTTNQDTVLEKAAKNARPLKSLLFARNNGEKPEVSFPLKNLLKLKDVELVPLNIINNKPKTKVSIPSIKLNPLQNNTEARDSVKLPSQVLFGKPSKIAGGLNKLNKAKSANVQIIPKRKPVATEILDAVPSPSEDNCVRLKPEADKSVVDMDQLEESMLDSSTETTESGDEQADDLIAKSTDTAIINSAEDVQLKSSEILEDEEVDDTEDFQIIDDSQTPVQESEGDIQIISQEDISDVAPGSVDLSEINEAEDRSNTVPGSLHSLKTLDEIRKSVVDKLEALQNSNRNALDSIKHNVEEISPRGDSAEELNQDIDFVENEDQISNVEPTFKSPTPESPIEDELQEGSVSNESVSFQDLQKMSDSILMASENHDQRAQNQPEESLETKKDTTSEEINESEIDNVLGMGGTAVNPKNDLSQSSDGSDKIEKTLCPSDLSKTSVQAKSEASSSINDISTGNDLEPLASDPIMDILRPTSFTGAPIINILRPSSKSIVEHLNDFGTKLRQSIVQPAPLINADDFNIFRTPSFNLPDISGLNANIPTLDNIRTRVSEILGGLARSAGDHDDSSELDSEDFSSNVNPVQSAGASSSNPVSIFPPLKPLEDINLDIIQLKPLPSLLGSSPQTADLPGLNFNRYKAKLAVPKFLDLKPLNLASTLGNNGGLVGTTLTIGPQKKEKTGKPKVKSNKNAEFVSSRGALNNNPTLADITTTMHENALNLLNIPKNTKSSTLQANNLIGDLTEKIRTHTEDTVKSIHETLNPSALAEVHNNVLKSANNLLASGRNSLQKSLQTPTHTESAVDNLRSQTQNTIQQLHNTLSSPQVVSDIRKNTKSILKSPTSSLDAVVDNLKHQSENTLKNVKQTLDTSRLSDSIQKSAQNVLKSSVAITPSRNVLGSPMHAIPTIDEVAGNLRSHTQSTLKNIHQTLNAPTLSDISTSIQKSTQQVLNSPITNSRPQILKNALQPSSSIDTVVDNLRSQTQNTMRNIQSSLNAPSLADISATVQKHAQNLLESPVGSTGRDAFKQVLQASSPINLTPHVDQVAKDLQRTLKATLKNSPIKDLPPLPHPHDVIQSISDHHSDMNDKLHALHMDLNDRLESIHNEVTDPARLRSILSPPGNRNFELFTIPLPMSSRSASGPKKARPVLQAKQPTLASQRKPSTTSASLSKPRVEPGKQSFMRASKGNKAPHKSFRMPSAASSPIPTHVERPALSLSHKKPFKLQDLKKPTLPKFKPLSKNKVTITFGPTTQSPALVGKSKAAPTTAKPKVSTINRFKPKPLVRQPTPWIGKGEARNVPRRLGEPSTSPSRTSPSFKTPSKAKSPKPISKPIKTEASSRMSPVSPKLRSQSPSKPIKTTLTEGRASAPSKLGLDKPKSPLLTKLSEALKNKNLGKPSQISRARAQDEMAPAASERLEKVVALEEPMKENTAYKCKMMCVKVDLNEDN